MKKLAVFLLWMFIAFPACASVNTLSGYLAHSQGLFAANGGPIPLAMALSYNSYDMVDGVLGVGWSHSYDIYLHENSDGTMVLTGGVGKRFYFTNDAGGYLPSPADLSVLTANTDSTWTIHFRSGLVFQFDTARQLTSMTDRYGNLVTLDNSVANQTTVTDPAGRSATIIYDVNGKVESISAPGGVYNFFYDASNRLYQVFYPEAVAGQGHPEWTYLYDAQGRLEFKTDPEQNVTQYGYDANGRCNRIVGPDPVGAPSGQEKLFDFDTPAVGQTTITEKDGGQWLYTFLPALGTLQSTQDPAGNVVSNTYRITPDGQNLIKTRIEPVNANSQYITTYVEIDAYGKPTRITGHARISGVDQPVDRDVTYTYDNANYDRLTSVTNNITGVTIAMNWDTDPVDSLERLTVVENDGSTQRTRSVVRFNANGTLHDAVDGNGATTRYDYDANGLLGRVTSPSGVATALLNPSALGLPQQIDLVDAANTQTQTEWFQYDAFGRVTQMTHKLAGASTSFATYEYDRNGTRTAVVDPLGMRTDFAPNAMGQIEKITQYLNQQTPPATPVETIFEYGGAGCESCGGGVDKLTGVIDANQAGMATPNKTSFVYDQVGNLELESDPLGKSLRYTWYPNGQLKEKLDVQTGSVQVAFTYKPDGKIATKQVRDENGVMQQTTFTYNPDGYLETATNPDIAYIFAYHPNGWLLSVTDSNGRAVTYNAYDAIGQRDLVTFMPGTPNEKLLDYQYDAIGRLDMVVSAAGTFGFGFDAFSRRSSLVYPNNVDTLYGYNAYTGWLDFVTTRDSALNVLASIGYPSYDVAGNRRQAIKDGVTTDYDYDDLYRVTRAVTNPTGDRLEENLLYDPVGNRTAGPTVKEVPGTYAHDDANRMLKGRQYSYGYDDFGNRTTRSQPGSTKTWSYAWDGDNQLRKAELKDGANILRTVTFKYDPFGRRIGKQVTDTDGGSTTVRTTAFLYDAEDIVYEFVDVTVNGVPQPQVATHYVHGPGIDEPLALVRNGQPSYYHADGLGSIVAITDPAGSVVQRYAYETYGQLTASDPSFDNFYTYTGREYDRETGMYYYRARYYDSMEGRFISKDPIRFAGGDVNLFNYVGGNPINYVDPSGLATYRVHREFQLLAPHGIPRNDPLFSHTYIVTTNPNGTIKRTYSWGNEKNLDGKLQWYPDAKIDRDSADKALSNPLIEWEKIGDDDFDVFIEMAFSELNMSTDSIHKWEWDGNCKDEANILINKARHIQINLWSGLR